MVKKSIFSLGLSLFLLALSISPPSFAKDSLPDSKANLRQKIQNDIIDLFKKHNVEIRDSIDLDDYLYGDGVTVIEWGELLDEGLLGDYLTLLIEKSGDGRLISGQAHGPRSQVLREEIFHD